jgi:hypothetical protein
MVHEQANNEQTRSTKLMSDRSRGPRNIAGVRRRLFQMLPDLTDEDAIAIAEEVERRVARRRASENLLFDVVGEALFVAVLTRRVGDS